jgi:hypothetical protein
MKTTKQAAEPVRFKVIYQKKEASGTENVILTQAELETKLRSGDLAPDDLAAKAGWASFKTLAEIFKQTIASMKKQSGTCIAYPVAPAAKTTENTNEFVVEMAAGGVLRANDKTITIMLRGGQLSPMDKVRRSNGSRMEPLKSLFPDVCELVELKRAKRVREEDDQSRTHRRQHTHIHKRARNDDSPSPDNPIKTSTHTSHALSNQTFDTRVDTEKKRWAAMMRIEQLQAENASLKANSLNKKYCGFD